MGMRDCWMSATPVLWVTRLDCTGLSSLRQGVGMRASTVGGALVVTRGRDSLVLEWEGTGLRSSGMLGLRSMAMGCMLVTGWA